MKKNSYPEYRVLKPGTWIIYRVDDHGDKTINIHIPAESEIVIPKNDLEQKAYDANPMIVTRNG